MAESDPAFYENAIRRIRRLIVILGIAGAAGIASFRGIPTGFAFLIGATASYLSFLGWQQIATAIGPDIKKKRSPRYFIVRILAFVALAYVIMRFLGLSAAAAVAGMLVSAAAVMLEIIYELIYART